MRTYKLVVLPGDGIGSEVMVQAIKVLDTIVEIFDINFEIIERDCGFEYMERTDTSWPQGTFELCRDTADAILLGAIGRPNNYKPLPPGEKTPGATIILGLRSHLDLFANVRPVMLFPNVKHKISAQFHNVWTPENVDLVIIRENTEGFYLSLQDKLPQELGQLALASDEQVFDWRLITRAGSERVIKFAFNIARSRSGTPLDGKSRVTCVDKSNVLNGCRLFRTEFNSVAERYPDIDRDYCYVDAFTQAILQKPEYYDVVVTSNLFGDIITDLAAVLQGGLGMAPSANLGDNHGMFEPVHGSAPDIAGKNQANPIGMILSTQMMLKWLGERNNDAVLVNSSEALMNAVKNYLAGNKNLPIDIGGTASTTEVGDQVVRQLKLLKKIL